MSDAATGLRRQIAGATELQAVVRTMRAIAASSIHASEASVRALLDYQRAVALGLGVCLRSPADGPAVTAAIEYASAPPVAPTPLVAIIFGSDQGLVGPFNDLVVEHAVRELAACPGPKEVWAVGERAASRLADLGLPPRGTHAVPNSVEGIAPLVDRLQIDTEGRRTQPAAMRLWVFHHRPMPGALYEPVRLRLLPLDAAWRRRFAEPPWPGKNLPECLGPVAETLRALIREYLLISLFQACAESMAAENASRLAAMERADKNIEELLTELHTRSHRLRQGSIDEELFDVTAGFQALGGPR